MKAIRLLMLTFVIASPFALYSMEEVENETVCNNMYQEKKKNIYNEFLKLEKQHQDDKELYSHVEKLFRQRNFNVNHNLESLPILYAEILKYVELDEDYYEEDVCKSKSIHRSISSLLRIGADPSVICNPTLNLKGSSIFKLIFFQGLQPDEEYNDHYTEIWNLFNQHKPDQTKNFLKALTEQSNIKQKNLNNYKNNIQLFFNLHNTIEYPCNTNDNVPESSTLFSITLHSILQHTDDTNQYSINSEATLLRGYKSETDHKKYYSRHVKTENELSQIYKSSVEYLIKSQKKSSDSKKKLFRLLTKIEEALENNHSENPFANEKGLKIKEKSSGIAKELCKILFGLCTDINVVSNDENKMGIYSATSFRRDRAKNLLRLFTNSFPDESSQFVDKQNKKITKKSKKLQKIEAKAKYLLTEIGYTTDTL